MSDKKHGSTKEKVRAAHNVVDGGNNKRVRGEGEKKRIRKFVVYLRTAKR
jgi:hypothetical protein